MEHAHTPKRRPANLSIRADIMAEAKEEEWLKNAMPAMDAHNERVRKQGTLLKPHWMRK